MKVLLLAAPLMARSGVYRSAIDLVTAARSMGLDWSALLGVRDDAPGASTPADGVTEILMHTHGRAVLTEIHELIAGSVDFDEADVVITLISQSDMVVSRRGLRSGAKHVAWVRGLPWPDRDEQTLPRRMILKALESRALRRADEVWATTPILAAQVAAARTPKLVQAGIPPLPRVHHGGASTAPLVWAGRLTSDKGVGEFLDVVRASDHPGRVHGSGPLEKEMRAISPAIVEWAGWQAPETLWNDASMYLSTSHREAYGRCAVEAASTGLPVILGDQVGVAPQLYTDADLFARFVLPVGDTSAWAAAVASLLDDSDLRGRVSEHVHSNALAMSIEASVASAQARLDTLQPNP